LDEYEKHDDQQKFSPCIYYPSLHLYDIKTDTKSVSYVEANQITT